MPRRCRALDPLLEGAPGHTCTWARLLPPGNLTANSLKPRNPARKGSGPILRGWAPGPSSASPLPCLTSGDLTPCPFGLTVP